MWIVLHLSHTSTFIPVIISPTTAMSTPILMVIPMISTSSFFMGNLILLGKLAIVSWNSKTGAHIFSNFKCHRSFGLRINHSTATF
ncbi:hypothetical protein F5H01DRAFT_340768 [Linnemannia elongata]|nr:hypothetical protein F5H01DRAFT_340768 [Linnemannia elongata]